MVEEFNPTDYDCEEDAYIAFCQSRDINPDSKQAQIWWGEYLDYLDPKNDPDRYRGEYPKGG